MASECGWWLVASAAGWGQRGVKWLSQLLGEKMSSQGKVLAESWESRDFLRVRVRVVVEAAARGLGVRGGALAELHCWLCHCDARHSSRKDSSVALGYLPLKRGVRRSLCSLSRARAACAGGE